MKREICAVSCNIRRRSQRALQKFTETGNAFPPKNARAQPTGTRHFVYNLLREPFSGLKRADVVIIMRSDLVSEPALAKIEDAVICAAPQLADRILRVVFQPTSLRRRDGRMMQLSEAAATNVHLMAGIGNPDAFQTTAVRTGMRITGTSWFPDQHHNSNADLDEVLNQAAASNGALVVTILKDFVKLPVNCNNVVALEIAAVFPDERHLKLLQTILLQAVSRSK